MALIVGNETVSPDFSIAETFFAFVNGSKGHQHRVRRVKRTFAPEKHPRYGRPPSEFPPSVLVRYSPKYDYSRLLNFPYKGAAFQPRMNSTVIQVQGLCRPNNPLNPESAAAVGVYYGPDCRRNAYYPLPIQFRQTSHRALLEAIRCTLQNLITMRLTELHPSWRDVIIMTDSMYVKDSLSRWVWKWERNGWNRAHGAGAVANKEAMQEIQNLMTYMENTLNMCVRFWKVDREDIAGANSLAKIALESRAILSL